MKTKPFNASEYKPTDKLVCGGEPVTCLTRMGIWWVGMSPVNNGVAFFAWDSQGRPQHSWVNPLEVLLPEPKKPREWNIAMRNCRKSDVNTGIAKIRAEQTMTPNISPEDRAASMDDLTAAIERLEGVEIEFDAHDAIRTLIAAARASQKAAAEIVLCAEHKKPSLPEDKTSCEICLWQEAFNNQVQIWEMQAAELSAVKAERDALRKDAARWKWMRVRISDEEIEDIVWALDGDQPYSSVSGDAVDSRVDAAIAASAADKEGT